MWRCDRCLAAREPGTVSAVSMLAVRAQRRVEAAAEGVQVEFSGLLIIISNGDSVEPRLSWQIIRGYFGSALLAIMSCVSPPPYYSAMVTNLSSSLIGLCIPVEPRVGIRFWPWPERGDDEVVGWRRSVLIHRPTRWFGEIAPASSLIVNSRRADQWSIWRR